MQTNKGAIATLGFSGLDSGHDNLGRLLPRQPYHDFPTLGKRTCWAGAVYTTTFFNWARYALTNASVLMGDPLVY
jgi:hypothetical protein